MGMFCTHCGTEISPGDRFCSSCGHSTAPPRDRRATVLVAGAAALVGAGLVLGGVIPTRDSDRSTVAAASPSTTTTMPSPSSTTSTTAPQQSTTTVASTTVAQSVELDSAEIARRFGDAVWRVEVEGCGYLASGSAFAISATHLVTNHHVVENDVRPRLTSRAGDTLEGRVIGSTYSPDVAVIEVEDEMDVHLQWAPTASVSEGDRIVTLGYPAPGNDFTVSPGNVLSFGSDGGYRNFIRTDGQVDHGNSGGPALNSAGAVVGVATSLEANPSGAQLVPQIFSSDTLRPVVDAMMEAPSYPSPGCETAEFEAPPGDYADFWTVIVASLPVDEYDYDRAYDRALDFFLETGLWADVLLTDLYPSLNPGYWAVYTGYFTSRSEADDLCGAIQESGHACYGRHVGWPYRE